MDILQLLNPRKMCEDTNCQAESYGVAKVTLWTAFFSMFVVGPRLWDCYKQSLADGGTMEAYIDTGSLLWLAVWVATIALTAHERINHFLTLMINSMSLPGFVVGIATLVGSGA